MNPQKKLTSFLVTKLLGINDVTAVVQQDAGNLMNDTFTVRAGERQDEILLLHERGGLFKSQENAVLADIRHNPKTWRT